MPHLNTTFFFRIICATLMGVLASATIAHGQETSPKSDDFFEALIRPLLSEKCWSCHGETKQQGGLRLDSRQAMLEGGDRGPAIEPGDPENSLLVTASAHSDDSLKMPPRADRLPDDAIASLSQWVSAGAVWPSKNVSAVTPGADSGAADHWSFQPVQKPPVPSPLETGWVLNPVDAFILDSLEKHGLEPSPAADKRTLIRRLTFDLTGLPPSPEEVEAFLTSEEPGAYENLVDRLLASPRYGERWGRHWLDIARYADSKGYVFQEERRYPFAYTYRDWVVRALNEDRPYDDFVRQQIAADRLASDGETDDLPALGFLTVGRRFLNKFEDITDDRIDVTTRGLMGLTVACARCHDHKYDPIPAEDYYSLYGIFASSEEPGELPLLADEGASSSPEFQKYQEEKKAKQAEVADYLEAKRKEFQEDLNAHRAEYLAAVKELQGSTSRDRVDAVAREKTVRPETLRWLAEREERQSEGETIAIEDSERLLNRADRNGYRERQQKVSQLDSSHPGAPARAMVMVDREKPMEPYVFLRGNPDRRGPAVPRRFLKVLSSQEERPTYDSGSGRLELAKEITRPENPLTARVMVNRVWMHHMGQGLVTTPSDFGLRSDPPSHPELLDWLAAKFIENGWSLKQLHRLILLSNTYRQQSLDRDEVHSIDPENKWLWRQNRKRLEFEPLRDSLLSVSGRLDGTIGGRPVEIGGDSNSYRRTIYAFIDRQNLDGLFRSFDFASPDASAARRFVTTGPQQSLYLMNHPFPAKRASDMVATLPEVADGDQEAANARIRRMYELLFGREPTADEARLGVQFVEAARASKAEEVQDDKKPNLDAWSQYAQVLLLTNEFTYID